MHPVGLTDPPRTTARTVGTYPDTRACTSTCHKPLSDAKLSQQAPRGANLCCHDTYSNEKGRPVPVFATPRPISVSIALSTGDVLIHATDRSDTVVAAHSEHGETPLVISFDGSDLRIGDPVAANGCGIPAARGEVVDLQIDLPCGSQIAGVAGQGGFRTVGALGACQLRTDYGEIRLDRTGPLWIETDSGDVAVDAIDGSAELRTNSGEVQIKRLEGDATIANPFGETTVREITGSLVVQGGDADVMVGRAGRDVAVRCYSGDIVIREVRRGTTRAVTTYGGIEIGIARSSTAVLDARSAHGHVHELIEPRSCSPDVVQSVAVHARTGDGDIVIFPAICSDTSHLEHTTMTLTTTRSAISAVGMRKSYGGKVVLDDVDITVPAGTVCALLGLNGAGKTTMVQILSTLIRADSGTIEVAGHDVSEDPESVRRTIGVTGQFTAVDELLTGQENLLLMADLNRLPRAEAKRRADELLQRFELAGEDAARLASEYSGGMRRKLDLAMTLMGSPTLIFLDEPTTGLDPRSRRAMWDIVRALVADGVTIFLTTQYLEEADELADRVMVLDDGHVVAEGTPAELKRLVPGGHLRLTFDDGESLRRAATALGIDETDGESLSLRVPGDDLAEMRRVLDALDKASVTASSLSVHSPDLDEVFLTLTDRNKQENPR